MTVKTKNKPRNQEQPPTPARLDQSPLPAATTGSAATTPPSVSTTPSAQYASTRPSLYCSAYSRV